MIDLYNRISVLSPKKLILLALKMSLQESPFPIAENLSEDKRIVAYLVLKEGQVLTHKEVRHFLKKKLPDYMIPVAFVRLNSLPLTSNNKVDYRALSALNITEDVEEETIISPRTPTEEILVGIWEDLLGREKIGIYDNFFELGGHSLLATQMFSRVRDIFSLELPVRCLFECPMIATLSSQYIELAHREQPSQRESPIKPIARNGELPLSFAQKRLWLISQLESASAAYNMSFCLHLKGSLNVTALQKSLNKIIQRHEVLRTTFKEVNGSAFQSISPTLAVHLPEVNLQNFSEEHQSIEVKRLAIEDAKLPFDLRNGPLLRVTLLVLNRESHLLLLTMHHIVFDGWSIGILIRELSSLYEAFSREANSPLTELPIQYVDFADWQHQWIGEEIQKIQLNYWTQKLANAPFVLDLPTDYPRPPIQTFRGDIQYFQISVDLTQRLKTLSRQLEATLFMTLFAVFAVLLYRYSNQEDILVGSPIANRNRSETESLIGFFVNTLVLRIRLHENLTFYELLTQVRQISLEAYANQDLPFEQLVEALQPERNLGNTPLFQVMFVLQNAPFGKLELPDLNITISETFNGTAKFDLLLSMQESAQGLTGEFEYRSDLFKVATIHRMAEHFAILLEEIVNDPQQHVSTLSLLTPSEQHQLLVDWNDTQVTYALGNTVLHLFEAQVARTPEAIAVMWGDCQLTYRELNAQANQVAHYLQALEVGIETLVGLCVEPSLSMVVGLLGILKAGAAYVPFDPAYPKERLDFMFSDSQVSVVLTQEKLVAELPEHHARVVCLDTDWEAISQKSKKNPSISVIANNLAYVIYTSGSTGKPKGVAMPHLPLSNLILWQMQNSIVSSESKTLQFAPISFDVSFQEIFSTWCSGGTLVLLVDDVRRDAVALLNLLIEESVERLFLPFVALQQLAEVIESSERVPRSLREIITAGEQLQITLPIAKLFQKLKDCTLHNHYGPSESHVVTSYTLNDAVSSWSALPPIGRPIANTQIYILDHSLQPVPIGVPGELYIGGIALARGYLNRPDLTTKKFIQNPFSNQPGARLYKTGDLARYLSDSNIEFLGRLDHQVKIRGFRIELGEVEATLAQHPDIKETVVIDREDASGYQCLVAYIVPNQEQIPSFSELWGFLKDKLPNYMIPSAFTVLQELPLSPSGKVDRRRLPESNLSNLTQETNFVSPRNLRELQLVRIWEDVLKIHPVGVQDNFFNCGGHSLLAMRLMSKIQQQFGKNLPLATLFQNQTIEKLASIIPQYTDCQNWSPLVAIQTTGNKLPFFCVHPGGGNVFCYSDLAYHLGADQPFYGLQSPGLSGEQKPLTKIEDIAAHYIEAIKTIDSQGPYQLGGWSLGGVIAFEMAQQLSQEGYTVALLALIDSYAPIPVNRTIPDYLYQWRNVADGTSWDTNLENVIVMDAIVRDLGGLFGKEIPIMIDELQQLQPDDRLNHILKVAQMMNLLPLEVGQQQMRWLLEVFQANLQAMYCYTPNFYPGKMIFFLASEQDEKVVQNFSRGWAELVSGGIEINEIPSDHYAILQEPYVQTLADKFKNYLARDKNGHPEQIKHPE